MKQLDPLAVTLPAPGGTNIEIVMQINKRQCFIVTGLTEVVAELSTTTLPAPTVM